MSRATIAVGTRINGIVRLRSIVQASKVESLARSLTNGIPNATRNRRLLAIVIPTIARKLRMNQSDVATIVWRRVYKENP